MVDRNRNGNRNRNRIWEIRKSGGEIRDLKLTLTDLVDWERDGV